MNMSSSLLKIHSLVLFCCCITGWSMAQIPSNDSDRPCALGVYTEDFGPDIPAGWEGDFMLLSPPLEEGWILRSGPTPTEETGPDGAFMGDYYLHLEASGPAGLNSSFAVRSGVIDLSHVQEVAPNVRFRVHMFGADIGTLKLNILSGPAFGISEEVMTVTGEQHTSGDVSNWQEAFIDLAQYEGQRIRLEFVGVKGSMGGLGDIAIDYIQVCTDPRVPTLGQWGLIVLALIFLIVGVIHIRQSYASKAVRVNV